jgi:hypothetical protein
MADLSGKTVGILATHMVEESELVDVRRNLAGAEVVLFSPESGEIQSFHDLERSFGNTYPVDEIVRLASGAAGGGHSADPMAAAAEVADSLLPCPGTSRSCASAWAWCSASRRRRRSTSRWCSSASGSRSGISVWCRSRTRASSTGPATGSPASGQRTAITPS